MFVSFSYELDPMGQMEQMCTQKRVYGTQKKKKKKKRKANEKRKDKKMQ